MKALVYTGPQQLNYGDMPNPVVREGEALIRVEAAGICGSDMHAYLGHDDRRPPPLILGHEAVGVVCGGTWDGRRVVMNPLVTCGVCTACSAGRENLCPSRQIISMPPRAGTFAEWISMPTANLIVLPDNIPAHKAALSEPIACGWHAVRLGLTALSDSACHKALVLGGGAIGVGAALSLTAQGVENITLIERNPARRAFIKRHTHFETIEPDDLPATATFDLVIDGVGVATTRMYASTYVRPGGVIVHIGLGEAKDGLDIRRMTLQEITFIGTYTYTAEDFRQTAAAIFAGRLGALDWVETRPLADGALAFADLYANRTQAPKIILTPDTQGG